MLETYVIVSSPTFSATTYSTFLNQRFGSSPRFSASFRKSWIRFGPALYDAKVKSAFSIGSSDGSSK
jgi:hypothetical protein